MHSYLLLWRYRYLKNLKNKAKIHKTELKFIILKPCEKNQSSSLRIAYPNLGFN